MDKDKKLKKTKCFFVLNNCCQYLFKIFILFLFVFIFTHNQLEINHSACRNKDCE